MASEEVLDTLLASIRIFARDRQNNRDVTNRCVKQQSNDLANPDDSSSRDFLGSAFCQNDSIVVVIAAVVVILMMIMKMPNDLST